MAAPRSQQIACSPARNGRRARPLNSVVSPLNSANTHRAAAYAFLLAPVAPAVILAFAGPTTGNPANIWWISFWLLAGYTYAAIVVMVFGIPMFLLLRRLNLVRWWSAIGSGALMGILAAVVLGISSASYNSGAAFILFATEGTVAALMFWIAYSWFLSKRRSVNEG